MILIFTEVFMRRKILTSILAGIMIASLVLPTARVQAATKNVTIDEDVYNLYTDNFPDPIADDVYSRFTTSVSDVEEYYLNFDQDEAETPFKTALTKNKIDFDEDYICYMKPFLYKYSDEGDDVSVTNKKVEVYFPLPSDAQEHPEDCSFYKLSSGKLTPVVPLDLYNIDDINYIKLDLASAADFSAYYGFVYSDPEAYEEEDDGEDENDVEDEEEGDDYEEDDITPTPKPTATPTPVPEEDEKEATPTPKPTATPTPKPESKDSGSGNKSGSGTGSKNTIPKTGDDFPLGTTLCVGAGAAAVLGFAYIIYKKKEK